VQQDTPAAGLKRAVAIVGVGETDYGFDHAVLRGRVPGQAPGSAEDQMRRALDRALADAGLSRSDVDGLMYCLDQRRTIEDPEAVFGIRTRVAGPGDSVLPMGTYADGGESGSLARAVQTVAAGQCDVLAIVYSAVSRSTAKQFGGATYVGDGRSSYYFHHPWGWSSQAAHWALMFGEYRRRYGASEQDLAWVAIRVREHALRNENAIMRTPLTVEEYLASPYIVRPLRRLDLCVPNDGAVCLILCRAGDAAGGSHVPVLISGWGSTAVRHEHLRHMFRGLLREQMAEAGARAFAMAGLAPGDVGHFQGYDASTFHLANQIEGYGLIPEGTALRRFREGEFSAGGRLPVNTSGGLLSEAYMHGWNHLAEATRQLRHEAGERQVPGLRVSMFSMVTTDSAHPILLERGER
jgi:acetyl-CoA acetyltransferase